MSGSSSGTSPGDSGDDDRDRSDERAGSPQTPSPEPSPTASDSDDVTIEDDGVIRWFLKTNDETVMVTRDVLSSVAIVAVVALLLFGVSGIWPPLVAVESGSMEPNMYRGDLIFVVEEDRFVGDSALEGTGVVTLERGQETDYTKFGNPGDVIVFRPNGNPARTPVIHRAHFWVDEGENWIDTKANTEFVGDATCQEVPNCPAPYAGFITKGDHNLGYDQTGGGANTNIVKPEWITGKAQYRIPWLGHVRLAVDDLLGGILVSSSPSSQLPDTQPEPAAMTPAGLASGLESNGDLAGIAGVAGGSIALAAGRYRS
ncbi:S24/S26 family peptidase [Natrinema limicola]|uniref:Peptidase S26B, signal peptidase n=1 Tax=Natrinema limicola JCM 13563 TaxID=1230457 RepID=M0C7R0_9EURY|nr:S26 family signal peptidase [Natrinema limicola]ELZ19306.1 peptidase S26B, signal peptidase [Natrinema limicola JCM 13563]